MYAPAGFDATLDKWKTQGVYARIKLLDHLPKKYRCIVFDRRETGQSDGRVERITWAHYVAQGKACSSISIQARPSHRRLHGLLPGPCFRRRPSRDGDEHDPILAGGGAKYRISTHKRFADHLAYVEQHGLAGVVSSWRRKETFNAEPRGGPGPR